MQTVMEYLFDRAQPHVPRTHRLGAGSPWRLAVPTMRWSV
jgi:hypothetical protein